MNFLKAVPSNIAVNLQAVVARAEEFKGQGHELPTHELKTFVCFDSKQKNAGVQTIKLYRLFINLEKADSAEVRVL